MKAEILVDNNNFECIICDENSNVFIMMNEKTVCKKCCEKLDFRLQIHNATNPNKKWEFHM